LQQRQQELQELRQELQQRQQEWQQRGLGEVPPGTVALEVINYLLRNNTGTVAYGEIESHIEAGAASVRRAISLLRQRNWIEVFLTQSNTNGVHFTQAALGYFAAVGRP
jgi:hypothetical protein